MIWPLNTRLDIETASRQWKGAQPFEHVVIDNFLQSDVAEQLAAEFPAWDDRMWYQYENAIEQKKALNHWDRFPAMTYRVMTAFNSPDFVSVLEGLTGISGLHTDPGLNGGGWHGHTAGGKLNVHLDYSLHPKLRMERRLNLILYITPGWKPAWGGQLGLWGGDSRAPGALGQKIDCLFNRAVLFDTTQNSWHGLPEPVTCPDGAIRRSLAVYYLTEPRATTDPRGKALFAPHGDQANDPAVLELIKKRASTTNANDVYRQR